MSGELLLMAYRRLSFTLIRVSSFHLIPSLPLPFFLHFCGTAAAGVRLDRRKHPIIFLLEQEGVFVLFFTWLGLDALSSIFLLWCWGKGLSWFGHIASTAGTGRLGNTVEIGRVFPVQC